MMDTPCIIADAHLRKQDGRPIWKTKYLYRVRYIEKFGPLPRRTVLHHLCENPACINLDHLQPMTQGEHLHLHGLPGDNHQAAKTHCPAGHPYSPENTYHWRNERQCRTCRAAARARYNARKRG